MICIFLCNVCLSPPSKGRKEYNNLFKCFSHLQKNKILTSFEQRSTNEKSNTANTGLIIYHLQISLTIFEPFYLRCDSDFSISHQFERHRTLRSHFESKLSAGLILSVPFEVHTFHDRDLGFQNARLYREIYPQKSLEYLVHLFLSFFTRVF